MDSTIIEVVALANSLASQASLGLTLTSPKQINSFYFSQLLSGLTHEELPAAPTEVGRFRLVIEALSSHLSGHVSLEHLEVEDLAQRNLSTIKNLLDIFSILYDLPQNTQSAPHSIANDSNQLSAEGLDIISEVLAEELGNSTSNNSTTGSMTTPPGSPERCGWPLHHSTPHAGPLPRAVPTHTPVALAFPPHDASNPDSTTSRDSVTTNPNSSLDSTHSLTEHVSPAASPQNSRMCYSLKEGQTIATQTTPTQTTPNQSVDQEVLAKLWGKFLSQRCQSNKRLANRDDKDSAKSPQEPSSPARTAGGDELLPTVVREFPFLELSPSMMRVLWQKQVQQIKALSGRPSRREKSAIQIRDLERKHNALLDLIKKEVVHTQRLKKTQEAKSQRRTMEASVRNKRHCRVRAKRYYKDYELDLRAKLQRQRITEEQIFRKAFEGGLAMQRERVREVRRAAREREEALAQQHQETLTAMETFYHDQCSLMEESLTKERRDLSLRHKAQTKVVRNVKRELRKKMEQEVRDLQETLHREEDCAHFRQLDAFHLRHKLAALSLSN